MPYVMFYEYFPELAKKETRGITVFERSNLNLPAGNYSFLEMYCNEPGCDCRRVFFHVVSNKKDLEAVITYGWESPQFYAKWMGSDDPHIIADLKGPSLNMGSPQSSLAPALLDVVRNILLPDTIYVERIKRHYAMFRAEIDGGARPRVRRKKAKREKRT